MNGKHIFYWDTCVFIDWLMSSNSSRTPDEMQGINDIAQLIEANKAILVVSSILRIEILSCTLSEEASKKLTQLFMRKNFQEIAVDKRIASLAHDIRNFYQQEKQNPINIKTPDAIHLATAIHYQVDQFHTFDGKRKRGLLRLSNNVAGHNLTICKPQVKLSR
jgi:predicted nucleic acid-binding protein